MQDHRILEEATRLDFTCDNKGYQTNIKHGLPHSPHSQVLGNALKQPLVDRDGYTLWLEHVIQKTDGQNCYWFMWYLNGKPTIPLSGVFADAELKQIAQLLNDSVP
jgi:hypothetical protein